MLGGVGIFVAIVLFFGWRKSKKGWQRVIAWIAGIWGGISILFYVFAYLSLSGSASTPTPIPVRPTSFVVPTFRPGPTSSIPSLKNLDCIHWLSVTIGMQGQTACVYGKVERIREVEGAWQARFGDDSEFFLASGTYYYPDVNKGDCVYAEGVILSSAERVPYIDISDSLYECEPWMQGK